MSQKDEVVLVSASESGVLGLLSTQLQNFPNMLHFLTANSFHSGSLILPQSISVLDAELNHNAELACECFQFLDVINLILLNQGIEPDIYYDNVINYLGYVREPHEYDELTVGKKSVENLIFNDRDDVKDLFKSNMTLLSLYIYSIVSTIFYK